MQILLIILSYLIGSTPFGFLIVKLRTGKDVREIASGRTGGTNAMRAGGVGVGLTTAFLDIGKGYVAVMLARYFFDGQPYLEWIEVFSAVAVIVGHNASIFLIRRDEDGKLKVYGGAGASTALGGATALWPPAFFILFIGGVLVFYFVGYASATTLSIGGMSILIFTYRWLALGEPWQYVIFGLMSLGLLVFALRPNIRRLIDGTERLLGFRAKYKITDLGY